MIAGEERQKKEAEHALRVQLLLHLCNDLELRA